MKVGLEVLLDDHIDKLKGKRVGLVTNITGVNSRLVPGIDLFFDHEEIHLAALYGPEHGIRGEVKAGDSVESMTDPATGLPVFSLYGDSRKPTPEMMEDVDVMVLDLQDIGTRYYTYIYTMAYVMEACRELGKPFIVLDRPNPINGIDIEGNLMEPEYHSFVGMYPIPNRHGLTIGELATVFNDEFGIRCDLTVIPMQGWRREMYFDQTGLYWVPPSLNVTGLEMNLLYPGTCLVEGTNLSEGRGTAFPFQLIGAPYINGAHLAREYNQRGVPGVIARPVFFIPTYQKHKDILCEGVQLHVTDRRELHSLRAGLTLLEIIANLYPHEFSFLERDQGGFFLDLLAGTDILREIIYKGESDAFLDDHQGSLEKFREQIQHYLIYQ